MNVGKPSDYNSDSDESDEDFLPSRNEAGESDASEYYSDDDDDNDEDDKNTTDDDNIDGNAEENNENTKEVRSRARKRKSNRCKKSSKSIKKLKDCDDKELEANGHRRTRQSAANDSLNRKATSEKNEIETEDMDKNRTEALWADFLSDVKPDVKLQQSEVSKTNNCAKVEKDQSSNKKSSINNKTITEVLEFAGEEVHIEKNDVDCQSKAIDNKTISTEVTTVTTTTTTTITMETNLNLTKKSMGIDLKHPTLPSIRSPRTGPAGLGCILNQIGKKKKLSVLEKTQIDWNSFKKDEGIEEQLQTFNKGKDGYLERQDFLERTDLRQFEIEKGLRQSRRNL